MIFKKLLKKSLRKNDQESEEEKWKEKWESNTKVNAEWAKYMMENILGYTEAREKYKQLYK